METTNADTYNLQSELFQEMNEEHGFSDTPEVKRKSF